MPTIAQAESWYTRADPVHDFAHVLRVFYMAEKLAQEEGADVQIVLAAALLHDAEGATTGAETRHTHHHQSAEFAAGILSEEGWAEERIQAVQHCIRAHRFRTDGETPRTLEAKILFDADKLDVIGAIGVARVIAYAALRGNPFYTQPSQTFLQTGTEEPGEEHSAYHEYLFKLRKIKDRLFTPSSRQIAEDRDRVLREYFIRLGEEMRGIR